MSHSYISIAKSKAIKICARFSFFHIALGQNLLRETTRTAEEKERLIAG